MMEKPVSQIGYMGGSAQEQREFFREAMDKSVPPSSFKQSEWARNMFLARNNWIIDTPDENVEGEVR